MDKKMIFKNIFFSFTLQVMVIISGLIVPKIILLYFGSVTNGLVSSINQFLNYISLLEGGISGVIMASLYKPLSENNEEKISGIINASRSFFRKIGIVYIIYMIIFAAIYPFFIKCEYSNLYIFALIIVLGTNLLVQYFFAITYKLLLNADQKVYFVSIIQLLCVVLNTIMVITTAVYFRDILIVKLFSATVFFIQPIIYYSYVKKHYNLDRKINDDNDSLKQRWDGFGQNVAFFIHTNTDVVVLTIFSNLIYVSIYSVYSMVVFAVKNLVISISAAIVPSLGSSIVSENLAKVNRGFDLYEFGIDFITTLFFTCEIILITPFINIYTMGIQDANYHQPVFAILISLAEMIYCFRDPYIRVVYASGHFRQTSKYAYGEALINIILSIILVRNYGLIGVSIGTVIAMSFRMIAHVFYLKNNILNRPVKIFFKKLIIFGGGSTLTICVSRWLFSLKALSYSKWFELSLKVFILCLIFLVLLSVIFYQSELKRLVQRKKHFMMGNK